MWCQSKTTFPIHPCGVGAEHVEKEVQARADPGRRWPLQREGGTLISTIFHFLRLFLNFLFFGLFLFFIFLFSFFLFRGLLDN